MKLLKQNFIATEGKSQVFFLVTAAERTAQQDDTPQPPPLNLG